MREQIATIMDIDCTLCEYSAGSNHPEDCFEVPETTPCKRRLDKADQIEALIESTRPDVETKVELLGETLMKLLVALGVVDKDAMPTPPELIVATETYIASGESITLEDFEERLKLVGHFYNDKIEQAKREERERIIKYLKGLVKSTPKASLSATIDLIEATKPEGE